MGEVLKPVSVKWGEAEWKRIASIRQHVLPFQISVSEISRRGLEWLERGLCTGERMNPDGQPAQVLQVRPPEHAVLPQRKRRQA